MVRISAPSGIASSSIGWIRREPGISSPGSTIAVSCVPTAWRNASVTMFASTPTVPRIDASGVISASTNPAASTIAAEAAAAMPAASIPPVAHRSRAEWSLAPARGG